MNSSNTLLVGPGSASASGSATSDKVAFCSMTGFELGTEPKTIFVPATKPKPQTMTEKQLPTVVEASHTIRQVAEEFSRLTPEMQETMSAYQRSAAAIQEAAQNFSTLIESVKGTFENMPAVRPFMDKIVNALTFIYDVVMAILNRLFHTVPTLIVRLFQLFGIEMSMITQFIRSVLKLSTSTEIEQGPQFLEAHGFAFVNLITEGIGTLVLGRTPDLQQMKYVNESLRYKQSILREVKDLKDLALNIIRSVPDQLQVWMSYVVPTKWWLQIFAPGTKYYDWIDEVNGMDSHAYTTRAAFDHVIQQKVMRLYRTGQELLKECTERGTRVPQVYRLLEGTFKKLDHLFKIVDMSALQRGTRRVPFVIYLYGPTGQGKSFLMTVLPAILANCSHDEPNLAYSRNSAVQHWDGYTGQFAVKYDDFGAISQANASPGEMGELITIVSNEQMRLPMASLEDKGEVFRSQVVIISSNIAYLHPNELRDASALHRRRHVFVKVEVKDEFRRPGRTDVDPDLIPNDYSHWVFTPKDNFRDEVEGRPLNYQQFVAMVKEKYHQHVQQQTVATANYEQMIEAANTMEAHGLDEDFQRFLGRHTLASTPSQRETMREEAEKFREALRKIDEEAEKPKWVTAFYQALPVLGVVTGLVALMTGVMAFVNARQELKKPRISKIVEGKEYEFSSDSMTKEQLEEAIECLSLLKHPRIQRMDAEGRWSRMYEELRGMTPELVEIWDRETDRSEYFGNLTDPEVEEVIDRVLRSKNVKRFLKAEGVYSGHHYKTANRMTNLHKPVVVPQSFQAEGCIDNCAMEITSARLVPHIAQINVGGSRMVCLMVGGRVFLSVYHLFFDMNGDMYPDGTPIELRIGSTVHRALFQREKCVRIGQDVALYQMDATLPCYKDTTHAFIKNEDLQRITEFPALIATIARDGIPMLMKVDGVVHPNYETKYYSRDRVKTSRVFGDRQYNPAQAFDPERDFEVKALSAWYYSLQSYPGMCGSVLIMLDKSAARKVCGIHSAGSADAHSLAQLVTYEMIQEGMKKLGFGLQPAHPHVDGDSTLGLLQAHGNFTKLGVIFNHPRISERTRIIPSLLHGKIFPVKTAPALLAPDDPRALRLDESILKKGIEKYGKPAPYVDMQILDRVVETMQDLFRPLEGTTERRILTQAEALNGVSGDEFIKRLDMTTSAGWPWNRVPGAKGKFPFIQREDGGLSDFVIKDPKLQAAVDSRFHLAKQGKRVESLWIDTLKDERRSLGRVQIGKTRVFTIPPVDYSLVCRRLCGAFNSAFYRNRLSFFSAVGIDPASLEWSTLYNELINNSNMGFAGDFGGWDGNLSPQFLEGVCRIMNDWYADDTCYQTARRVLFDEIIHTPQCALNEVYYTHVGNPSGNPLTVIVNTIVHYMYLVYIFYKRAPAEFCNYKYFVENFRAFIYGDDGIYSIKPNILEFFNPAILKEELDLLHLEFTNATKTGPAELLPVSRLTFLKRGFRPDGFGRQLAVIDIQTITELVNWTRQCADLTLEQASVDNINDSLAFMYAYGKEQFDKHRKKILEVLPAQWHAFVNDYLTYHKQFLSKVENQEPQPFLVAHGDTGGEVQPISSATPITTNVGEEVRQSENTKGIIIQSQRTEEVSGSTLVPLSIPQGYLQRQCVGDPVWGLKDIVNRRVWIGTYQWTTAQATGTTVVKYTLPHDLLVNYFQTAPFERFVFWRGSMIMEFQVSGMRTQLGCLKIFNIPFTHFSIGDVWHTDNPTAYYGLNPLTVDPSSNQPQKLIVPFTNPKTFLSINGQTTSTAIDFNSTVYVVVLVPLTVATGSATTADLTVWASFGEDTEFHVPLNSSQGGGPFNEDHARQMQRRYQRFMRADGGTVSSTNNITAYGNMDGTCIPQRLTADDFQGAASGNTVSVPAFDRAARTPNPFNVIRKYIQNFTNSKGSELCTRLDLDPSNLSVVTRQHFSTNQDEMLMKFLHCTPTWVRNIPWTGIQPAGTSLYSGFIGPMTSMFTPGTTTQVTIQQGTKLQMTMWEYNSMRYAFWKGGMRIRLEIIATAFHVGRLCLTLNYGAPPGVQTGLRDATSQYAVQFELNNEKSVFEYDIPWLSSTPWKRMCRGPSSPDDPDVASAWWTDYFLGSFDLSVVTQLKTISTAPPDVVIILSYSGSPDFSVYMPSNNNATFQGVATEFAALPLTQPFMRADGDVGTRAGVDATPAPPAAPATIVPATLIAPQGHIPTLLGDHFGSTAVIKHVRDELRRYYPIDAQLFYARVPFATTPSPTNDSAHGFVPIFNTTTPPTTDEEAFVLYDIYEVAPNGFAEIDTERPYEKTLRNAILPIMHHSLQYRFWRGSLRYKAIFGQIKTTTGTNATPLNSVVVHIPHGQFTYDGSPIAARPNWAAMAATMAQEWFGTANSAGGDSFVSMMRGCRYAADMSGNGMVNYVEIEVPFISEYNVMLTKQGLRSGFTAPDVLMSGVLMFLRTFTLPYAASPGYSNNISAPLTLLQSVGDDFRYGCYLGVPQIMPSGVATGGNRWPDSWIVTAPPPPLHRKVEKPKEGKVSSEEEDFEKIPVKEMTKSMVVRKFHQMMRADGASSAKPIDFWEQPRSLFPTPKDTGMPFTGLENVQLTTMESNLATAVWLTLAANIRQPVFLQLLLLRDQHKLTVDVVRGETWIITWVLNKSNSLRGFHEFVCPDVKNICWDNMDQIIYRQIYSKIRYQTADWSAGLEQLASEQEAADRGEFPGTSQVTDEEGGGLQFYAAHGETVADKLQPTNDNFRLVIAEKYGKYLADDSFTARSAINEITQRIETAKFYAETTGSGPSHQPTFTCEAHFEADNARFGHVNGVQTACKKKAAEEAACVIILEQLHALAPEEDVCRKMGKVEELPPLFEQLLKEKDQKVAEPKPLAQLPITKIMVEESLRALGVESEREKSLNRARHPGARELIDLMQNLPSQTFLSKTTIKRIRVLLGSFGGELEVKAWTQDRFGKTLFKIQVQIKMEDGEINKILHATLENDNYLASILRTLELCLKDAIWALLEVKCREDMDYYVLVDMKLEK